MMKASSSLKVSLTPRPPGDPLSIIHAKRFTNVVSNRFYLGKRTAFIYRAKREIRGSKLRVIWGTIVSVHGTLLIPVLARYLFLKTINLTSLVSRKFRLGPRSIQAQSSSSLVWGLDSRYAIPFVYLDIFRD